MKVALGPVALVGKIAATAVVISGAVVAMAGIAVVGGTVKAVEAGWDITTDSVTTIKRTHARSRARRQGTW